MVFIADDDNAYMPTLYPALRKVVQVALFPTGNMGYDGIEGKWPRQNNKTTRQPKRGRNATLFVFVGANAMPGC